jgi:dTDP-L-rhamnose 4-epimerase
VPVSVLKVAETLSRLFERDTPIAVTGNFRIGDIRHNFASIEKIRSLLGFEPAYGFDQGIAAFAAWASASGPQSNAYESSLDEMRRKGLMR